MKIPETSANVGAYYGNEENGQWQPNGVIIDNGVGGGVVGSGDAGMHRAPLYPLHIPRGHVPAGYVMAGAYYGAGYAAVPQPDDFADYMWMENEEEFDKQVMQQLEEEALMEQCIEAMLQDEQRERRAHREHRHAQPTTSNGAPSVSLEEAVSRSTLNPLAAEFVPTGLTHTQTHTHTEEKSPAASEGEASASRTETDSTGATDKDSAPSREEAVSPPKDPPEVSAADVVPTSKPVAKKDKEVKKQEPKKVTKPDPKKKSPVAVKSETKVQPKKKEVKSVKSETKVEERKEESEEKVEEVVPVVEAAKPSLPTSEEPSGPKPINYAAAARASKPKPKTTTTPAATSEKPQPITDKPKPKPTEVKDKPKPVEKKPVQKEKSVPKEKVNVSRKNSAK